MKTQKVEIEKAAWWQDRVPLLTGVKNLTVRHALMPHDCKFEIIEGPVPPGVTVKTGKVTALIDGVVNDTFMINRPVTVILNYIGKRPSNRHGESFLAELAEERIPEPLSLSKLIPKVLAEIRAGIAAADVACSWDGKVIFNAPVRAARVEFKIISAGAVNQPKENSK